MPQEIIEISQFPYRLDTLRTRNYRSRLTTWPLVDRSALIDPVQRSRQRTIVTGISIKNVVLINWHFNVDRFFELIDRSDWNSQRLILFCILSDINHFLPIVWKMYVLLFSVVSLKLVKKAPGPTMKIDVIWHNFRAW